MNVLWYSQNESLRGLWTCGGVSVTLGARGQGISPGKGMWPLASLSLPYLRRTYENCLLAGPQQQWGTTSFIPEERIWVHPSWSVWSLIILSSLWPHNSLKQVEDLSGLDLGQWGWGSGGMDLSTCLKKSFFPTLDHFCLGFSLFLCCFLFFSFLFFWLFFYRISKKPKPFGLL